MLFILNYNFFYLIIKIFIQKKLMLIRKNKKSLKIKLLENLIKMTFLYKYILISNKYIMFSIDHHPASLNIFERSSTLLLQSPGLYGELFA